MSASNLCQVCSQINFDGLRNPLLSDVPAFKEGRPNKQRIPFREKSADDSRKAALGTFADICQKKETCQLCRLIERAIGQYAVRSPDLGDECQAEPSFYATFRDSRGEVYWTRRLSILIHSSGKAAQVSSGDKLETLAFVFQACPVGAASAKVDEQFMDPRPETDMMIFGGRQRPLVLDLGWVKRWMSICKTDHGMSCEESDITSTRKVELVRFVDVTQMCLATLEDIHLSDVTYIALSYVWGGPPKLALLRENVKKFAEPGGLATESLSQTIADAIFLVHSLGVRYLWIDALCIIQDDLGDKKIQIGAMSQIYGFSFFTIIAASSSNAEGGLPGLRPKTRTLVQEEVMVIPPTDNGDSGLSLMTTLQPQPRANEHYLEQTPWNSRGWTMQERALSRRALVFMPQQVYWVCREATFCEESYFENNVIKFNRFHGQASELTLRRPFHFYEPEDDEMRFWNTYQKLVASYTRRAFTHNGDVFDGFFAVLQGLAEKSGEDFPWGLPRSHFEQGLLWTAFQGVQRRESYSTLPMTSFQARVPFPSWSWMGWQGEAWIAISDEREDGELPEIIAFEHYHNPLCMKRVRSNPVMYESGMEEHLPSWKHNHAQSVTLEELAFVHPQLNLSTIPESLVIFFWTSSATFNMKRPDDSNHRFSIVDGSGCRIGSTGNTISDTWDDYDHQQEFVVIGSRRNEFSDPVLLVLQIKWEGGLAYRLNSGEIDETEWENAAHKWKLIPLT